jgi:DNA-binding response OmpR family regulator
MPGVDGLAVLSDLKETLPDLAVIMLTGCGNEQVAVEAMKQGAMDYLVKGDIQPRDLMATLMNVLEKQQMKRTIQRQQQQLLEAERQRVMIESLGAACHHLGQPVTVLSAFLTLIQREVSDEKISTELLACEQAVEQIRVLLERFQTLRTYRTEPYLPGSQTDGSASEGSRILQI